MARRNAKGAQPAPSYLTTSSYGVTSRTDESAWIRFVREQIFAPENRAGNWGILTGVAMFAGAIVGIRLYGEALAPV
ncbi:hypothetical protein BS47DRAFT_432753 [Hydnum rufescens UP504]|uniref:Uncharacterized protein n=1 Tax=Hydnum rufescens UP504 TaxID=1448309 RepID=A0A9P6AIY8_9AGAM|nr:hypothetical protein BS47DRAFT_432753 [Hydnum rufescens UP504]